jgi:diguanylate cyclase (GGDEF)-like protein/PAS domain S-box-containing protein
MCADDGGMPLWARAAYAVSVGALTVAYVALATPPRWMWAAIGLLSVLATAAGIRSNRPRRRLPWYLVAAGTAAFISGDIAYDLLTGVFGLGNPFPSVADVLYLITYPLFAAGLLLMVRARSGRSDMAALVDALIVTVGLGLLSWVFLVKPYVEDDSLSWLEKAVSVAYPLGDVLLLAVLVRLLVGAGAGSRALGLLTVGTVGLLASDVLYGLGQLNGLWQTGGLVDIGWIVFYAAWGAAALQPDMVGMVEPVRARPRVLSRRRLMLLVSVSLVAPGLLLWEGATGSFADVVIVAIASAVMFLLVIIRLDGLISLARDSTQRERVLRHSGEKLVATAGRDDIYRVTAEAALEIGGVGPDARALVVLNGRLPARIVFDSTTHGPLDVDVQPLLSRHAAELRRHHFLITDSNRVGVELVPLIGPGVPMLMAAFTGADEVSGALVVIGTDGSRAGVVDSLCSLATQAALALESADLTEQVLQRRNEAHFRSLIQNASDVILVVDADLHITYQTPSVQAVLGLSWAEVDGRPVTALLAADDVPHARLMLARVARPGERGGQRSASFAAEWRVRHADGRLRAVEVTCSNLLDDPSVQGLVLTLHDITDRRGLEEELKVLAFHDTLTKLPNRALFLDRVEHALGRQGRHREHLAVMLIDLDDFKMINDTRGHGAGDILLIAVAERLRVVLRDQDTATRLGGDEFAVFVEGLAGDHEATQLAERILFELGRPYHLEGEEVAVRASIGVATSEYGSDAAELLRQADLAMYAAKDAGKGTHEFFRASMLHRLESRLKWRHDLERGLREDEFVLHYQPVCNLDTGQVVGAEALLRWQHPEKGLVLAGEFIDVVEQTDLDPPLGAWVLDQAVAQATQWAKASPDNPVWVSVNVTPRQLREPTFVDTVASALRRHDLPGASLTVEMTERMLADEGGQTQVVMQALRDLGVGLALDDFGTGYSSLAYLRRFPVNILKIDRSFVSGVDRSADDRALVEAIVRLAESFRLEVVAEGIETSQQRHVIQEMGCDRGQGFLFSRPIPGSEFIALLDAQTALGTSLAPASAPVPIRRERIA